jgi:glycosyltransferase involved in cell wall biosynthesis
VTINSVSVVIPTYNSERFIVDTLESIAAQTIRPLEIILADGGSTDRTLEIAGQFDVRIAARRSRNIPGGRNIGIREARGAWIAFIDHDDLWVPTKLEQQLRAIEEFPDVQMVLTDYVVFSEPEDPGSRSEASEVYRRAIERAGSNYFASIDFTGTEWIVPLTSSALVKKGIELFDEDLHGTDDIEFFLRMMTHPFVMLDLPLTRWRLTRNSYSQKDPVVMDLDFVTMMNKVLRSPQVYPRGIYECVRGMRSQRLRQTSLKLLKRGRPLDSLSMFAESLKPPPL